MACRRVIFTFLPVFQGKPWPSNVGMSVRTLQATRRRIPQDAKRTSDVAY
jgi:hypothetical protein